MRMLGDASIQSYRWDVVYLYGALLSDPRPEVKALAPLAAALLDEVRSERDNYERAEEADIVASAVRGRADFALDRTIITFGGVARVIADVVYKRFFGRLSPSRIAKLALDDEMLECKRIIGELEVMPADHALRVAHEPSIREGIAQLEVAMTAEEGTDVALSVARSRLRTFKERADAQRLEIFGDLLKIVRDKDVADSYFRPTTAAPQGGDKPPPAPVDSPVTPVAT